MRRIPLVVILLAACADSGTGPEPTPDPVSPLLEIVAGDGQQDTVAQQLPQPLVVRVVADTTGEVELAVQGSPLYEMGDPIPGELINWRVLDDDCGDVFVEATIADTAGLAQNFWTLGPQAGNCSVQARVIRDGQPVVVENFTATALAGAPADITMIEDSLIWLGARTPLSAFITSLEDEYGNATTGEYFLISYAGGAHVGDSIVAETEAAFPLVIAVGAGQRDTTNVLNLRDLRELTWSAELWCPSAASFDSSRTAIAIDSARYDHLAIDSVVVHFFGTGQELRYVGTDVDTIATTFDVDLEQDVGQLSQPGDALWEVVSTDPVVYRVPRCSGAGYLELRAAE